MTASAETQANPSLTSILPPGKSCSNRSGVADARASRAARGRCKARSVPPLMSAPNCRSRPSSSPIPERNATSRMHRPASRRRHSPITIGRSARSPLSSPMPLPLQTAIRTCSLKGIAKSTSMWPAKYSTNGFTSDTRSFLYRKLSKPLMPQAVWSLSVPSTCSMGQIFIGPSGPGCSSGAKSNLNCPSGTHSSVSLLRRLRLNATSCHVMVAALSATSDFALHCAFTEGSVVTLSICSDWRAVTAPLMSPWLPRSFASISN